MKRLSVLICNSAIALLALNGLAGCTAEAPVPTNPPSVTSNSMAPTSDQLTNSRALDGGPREHAMGTVVLDEDGSVSKYVVAEGDMGKDIAARLGIPTDNLKDEDGDPVTKYPIIFPGQVLSVAR